MSQAVSVIDEVKSTLVKMGPEFKMALPPHIAPDKFIRVAMTAVQNNPDILQCKRQSLYNSFLRCAGWGLIPDGQEAAIVKFGDEAVAMDMIEGILKLIRNSGELSTIDAQVVHKNDKYDYWIDEKGPHFEFRKNRGDRGEAILTFAYAITKDGALYFEEVTEEEMKKIEGVTKTKTVWNGPFKVEMKRKSALRRLSKRLPKSTDLEKAMDRHDELFEIGGGPEPVPTATKDTSSRLNNAVQDADFKSAKSEAEPEVSAPAKAAEKPATKPAPAPTAAPAVGGKSIQGVIDGLTSKNIIKDGQTSKKFGGRITGVWYGTFDANVYQKMEEYHNHKALVEISYNERIGKNDQGQDTTYFDAVSVKAVTVSDLKKQGEDIPL